MQIYDIIVKYSIHSFIHSYLNYNILFDINNIYSIFDKTLEYLEEREGQTVSAAKHKCYFIWTKKGV